MGEGCFEGERLYHVDFAGGEPDLEEVRTASSVAGLAGTVHLEF